MLQRLLGFAALADQVAQVAVPEHHGGDQQTGDDKDLQDQRAVVVPGAVADQCVGAPAVGQLCQFVGLDAQQCLVENRMQLACRACRGEGTDHRLVAEQRGDAQAILEQPADEVGGVDLRADGCIGLALGDVLHE
ncbi:hypothetical protein D3C80_1608660 [compost metagenome]